MAYFVRICFIIVNTAIVNVRVGSSASYKISLIDKVSEIGSVAHNFPVVF